ncbi:MAG: molecular chaperone HtpG [Candidatus Sumerlaeia bacterium]|nr:molecular chaperone HtpG [Candidatus Sumerlaeia bacterium]
MTTETPVQPTDSPDSKAYTFQAEIAQVLDIVINSLYTHKEIFVRELISNAADALEKFRHESLIQKGLPDSDRALEIRVELDEEKKIFRIKDTGIGMTEEELQRNLGTIAHSGTKSFLKKMAEGAKEDVNLIGQFGVGFYSAFMVANKVTVETRSFQNDSQGYRWESNGIGTYTITPAGDLPRGTTITLELKEDDAEYSKDYRIRDIITRFSNFVNFPVFLGEEKINTITALWTKSKSQIEEKEYEEFYRFIANAPDEPQFTFHFSADAPIALQSLLFVPKTNMERFGFGKTKPGVDLYCRKVLIMKHPEGLLPDWLRFLRGVIDSEDLPLNISRESLQDSRLIGKLSKVIVSRFLKFLGEQAEQNPEKYKEFYATNGQFLKEGLVQDFMHRDELAKLLRFESSKSEPGKMVSLQEYVSRMAEGQDKIYFINGPTRAAIEAGPYLEAFAARDIEVLYTFDSIDDFVLNNLANFQEKAIISADSGEVELPELKEVETPENAPLPEDRAAAFCEWLKGTLGDHVASVKTSKRLKDSPALASTEGTMSSTMQRMMMTMGDEGKQADAGKFMTLEINPRHPLIKKLEFLRTNDEAFAKQLAEQLYDNTLIAAGILTDPRTLVQRMNQLLSKAAGL